jgi:phytoene dehydrogenase-like protein
MLQMSKTDQSTYDAIIIGAGISGLVCGCYLVKAGMKVLIAEQHFQPGGYCTSFKRNGFTFDAAAHSFGSYRESGNFNKVVKELGLDKRVVIKKFDPTDIVVTPDHKVTFWADRDKTVYELQKVFPNEHKIREFIAFMANPQPVDIAALRNKSFKDLLDQYFIDDKIKTIISCPLFFNSGLPPSLISAFTGAKIFTEFVMDGGYCPEGGMQELPNAFADIFREFGGVLMLSSPVAHITTHDNIVSGIVLESDEVIRSRYVISNCDARLTFIELLGEQIIGKRFINMLNTMTPSLSMFIAYLGIDRYFDTLPQRGSTLWSLPHYDLDKLYESAKSPTRTDLSKYLLRVSPDGKSILAMANTSYKDKHYWDIHKNRLLDTFITNIEKTTVPDLSKHIVYKEAATPFTLYRYTRNSQGAAYGWESTKEQFMRTDLRKPAFIQGLYLTGHWTTYAQGIAGVAYLGYDLANTLIKKEKTRKK